jgi:tetratricopeptide (TPR) repeat protein
MQLFVHEGLAATQVHNPFGDQPKSASIITCQSQEAKPLFCSNCGKENPPDAIFCSICGRRLTQFEKTDLYLHCIASLEDEDYDAAINALSDYCAHNITDLKASIVLARAYLGKCDQLKQSANEEYKVLVQKPFLIGKRLIAQFRYEPHHLAEGFYLCSRSYFINERSSRAIRYMEKAVECDSPSKTEYVLALADLHARTAIEDNPNPSKLAEASQFKTAIETYNRVINMDCQDTIKARSYYGLGYLYFKARKYDEAISCFKSVSNSGAKGHLLRKSQTFLDEIKESQHGKEVH